MTDDVRDRLAAALEPLPTEEGGTVIMLATAGTPPAVALLSTGDVLVDGTSVRAVTYGGSSASKRLGGSFTLLVPIDDEALRVEVVDATARPAGNLAVLEGTLADIRPTAEPPWVMEMRFRPDRPDADTAGFLAYWRSVRQWLVSGATGEPPKPAL